jgi:hypothetical protein
LLPSRFWKNVPKQSGPENLKTVTVESKFEVAVVPTTPLTPEQEIINKLFDIQPESSVLRNTKFNPDRDLLVLPAHLKEENLDEYTLKILRILKSKNRVIKLEFVKKPAIVRSGN